VAPAEDASGETVRVTADTAVWWRATRWRELWIRLSGGGPAHVEAVALGWEQAEGREPEERRNGAHATHQAPPVEEWHR
jgi:hypothetical protein